MVWIFKCHAGYKKWVWILVYPLEIGEHGKKKKVEGGHDPKCKAGGSATVGKHDLGDHY
jgi:hypothetical protein